MTRPYTPQTNGMVERFNRRIQDKVLCIIIHSHAALEHLLQGFCPSYNARRQRVLKGQAPNHVVAGRLQTRPELADPRFRPPNPCSITRGRIDALRTVQHAKEVSQPNNYLGQRQGDLLNMKRVQWQPDGAGRLRVRLRQAKRNAWINVPLHPMVEQRFLAAEARRGSITAATVLWNDRLGAPWNADTFRHHFSDVRAKAAQLVPTVSPADAVGPLPATVAAAIAADPAPVWFMDTRDTAVTKLAEAGCTIPEICSITGYDEESAYKVLKHYLALNGSMADAAIAKLVAFEEQKQVGSGTSD